MEAAVVSAMNAIIESTSETTSIEQFYTVAQVAPCVGMSEQGLYAAIRERQFPAVRIGTRIRIPASALRRWADEQLQKTRAETGAGDDQ